MNRIKELRTQKGISQRALATDMYVNQTAVSQWERGATNPSTEMTLRLAEYFGVSVDYLLGVDLSEQQKSSVPPMDTEREKKRIAFIAAYDAMPPEEQDLFYEWLQLRGKI